MSIIPTRIFLALILTMLSLGAAKAQESAAATTDAISQLQTAARMVFPELRTSTDAQLITNLRSLTRAEAVALWQSGKLWKIYPKRDDNPDEYDPIFIDISTSQTSPSWTDWNRISFGPSFIPKADDPLRIFINVNAASRRLAYFTYYPIRDASGALVEKYDLTKPPAFTIFTREQYIKYYSQIPLSRGRRGFSSVRDATDAGRSYYLFGVSPKDFKLGNTTSTPAGNEGAAYLGGYSYSVNPYTYLNLEPV